MPQVQPKVVLIRYTPAPQELVAMAGKLCYSASDLDDLSEGVSGADQTRYLNRLMDMGHLSPIEHASFTFGIEGVSRSLLAQITRHRIASFSVQSQRYVALGDDENGFDVSLALSGDPDPEKMDEEGYLSIGLGVHSAQKDEQNDIVVSPEMIARANSNVNWEILYVSLTFHLVHKLF